ncbi:MAG: hypothetical protein HZA12_02470 [Nitrospirae bacterium]|nr:hypothetical protein [Nitrospirota bacterium]
MPFITLILTVIVYVFFVILSPILFAVPPASQWVVDGGVLNVAKSNETSLAVTPHALAPSITFNGDTPYVTWAEINSKGVSLVHVRHKDGNQWVEYGGLLNISMTGHASSPTLASAKNNLYAVWSEADSKGVAQIYVKEWNGKEWVKTGDSLNINPANNVLSPVISGNDTSLYAAWLEVNSAGISGLYVKEWDGNSWRLLGGKVNKAPERHAFAPSLASDKTGVYLAWAEYDKDGISQVYVSRWYGERWDPVGEAINTDSTRHALSPSLVIPKGVPYIAWMEYNDDNVSQVYVKRWNGKEWVKVGGSVNVNQARHGSSPSLAMKDGIPYVAWVEIGENDTPDIYVKHWEKNSWAPDGGYVNDALDAVVTAPSISVKDNSVYVAFSETDTSGIYRLYVKRLTEGRGEAAIQRSGEAAKSLLRKKGSSPTFFTAMPKDPKLPEYLPPPLAFQYLPRTYLGEADWMAGVRNGIFKPFDSIDPEARPSLPPLDLDIILPVKKEFGIPGVIFPHSSHTFWLDCRNCHPTIFTPKRGGNPVTMHRVIEGEYCGRCHGVVAFRVYDCFRCHSNK